MGYGEERGEKKTTVEGTSRRRAKEERENGKREHSIVTRICCAQRNKLTPGHLAYPDDGMYQFSKFEGSFVNASDRLACQIITDRGIAMIPLPKWRVEWSGGSKKKLVGQAK